MARRNSLNDDVMIAVDPHKASNTAAVLDPVSKTVIQSARFANSANGYGQLARFAARWEQRRWAVEGCHGAGRSLAQRLAADGETVLDVPAKLAARVRVYSRAGTAARPARTTRCPSAWPRWMAPASPGSPVTVRW
jgi:transposase